LFIFNSYYFVYFKINYAVLFLDHLLRAFNNLICKKIILYVIFILGLFIIIVDYDYLNYLKKNHGYWKD
jgi:hypothetical protein